MDERVRAVIVGAGPAGAAAGMFLKRAGLEPLLLEEDAPGGLLREANLVENYPGFPEGIVGLELASLIAKQLERLEVRLVRARVTNASAEGELFVTKTVDGNHISDCLIIATGTRPKKANIPGAAAIEGKRLSYGISPLTAEDIQGRRIAILGGGDAAFDYAINLSDRGGSVTILSRSDPTCLPLLVQRARERKVDIITGCGASSLAEASDGITIACDGDDRHGSVECDFVVVAHGREPQLDILDPGLRSRISIDNPPATGVSGLFLAGDVVRGRNRQAAIAAGDGVMAAMMAERFFKDGGGHA